MRGINVRGTLISEHGVTGRADGGQRLRGRLGYAAGVIAALVLVLGSCRNAESQLAPQVIHAFSASASAPNGLILARDGNFYGTTASTLFRMTPGGTLTTLHVFNCAVEGCGAIALIRGRDGNLYGTSRDGGKFGGGTVFKATTGGVVTTLHAFDCNTEGCGSAAALVEGADGNFYGTTPQGPYPFGAGTVFRMTPTGALSTLRVFDFDEECPADVCYPDGAFPFGGLIQAKDGNFYGTTSQGGTLGGGTVFRLTSAGDLTTVRHLDCSTEGCVPSAGVIQASDGNFYGLTGSGGLLGSGTIFKLTTTGNPAILHDFDCSTDGCGPMAGLIQAKDGALYGTTLVGGALEGGTIFKVTLKGAFTTLHAMDCGTEGCNSQAALVQSSDGNVFYGAASCCGVGEGGTIFKVTPNGALTILQSFGCTSGEGCFPRGALVQAKDGNFYGTTAQGGALGGGTVFRLTPGGVFTTLHAFDCPAEGCRPGAALIQASDDNLYGTTPDGGTFDAGTIFRLSLDGVFTTLHTFHCPTDGCRSQAALIQASDGNLYGTTTSSGPSGFGGGTVFRLTLDGVFSPLHAFDCRANGCGPYGAVIQASDGDLYGTTAFTDGSGDGGTVFRLTLDGVFTTLHVFDCLSNDGCGLFSTLIQASDGNLYGTTAYWGPPGSFGTVFKVTPAGDFATLHAFDDLDGESCSPSALMQAGDGNLYGNSVLCGGGLFKLSLGGDFTKLVDCAVACPSFDDALIEASDGYLYGASGLGGSESGGSLFRLVQLVPNALTALGPARVWIGLKNSDDVGARLDLRAEVWQNSTLIGSGEVLSVSGGSSGFNNAKLHTIPLALSALDSMAFGDADIFSITVSVRNACTGSGRNSFTARLWFNDVTASSRFGVTIAGDNRDYLLRSGFTLSTAAGASRQSVDASGGAKCGPFVPFGTWRIVPP